MNFLLVEHGAARKAFTFPALQRKGLDVFLAATALPEWLHGTIHPSNVIITDTYNSPKLLADVVGFMVQRNIEFSAVGTFFEDVVCQTADVARALNLKGVDPGAARRSSTNKALMRKTCKEAGIPTPRFLVIRDPEEDGLQHAVRTVGLPCVVKPVVGGDSYGAIKVESLEQVACAIDEIRQNLASCQDDTFKNFTGLFLVEEYLDGPEVSVDGVVFNNEISVAGTVEFVMGPEPRFAQEADYIPARFEPDVLDARHRMARDVVAALGFDNCGFHCEQRITKNGPMVIEIAARLPGGPLQPGYRMATGVDLTSAVIDIWLGRKPDMKPTAHRCVLQKAVFPRRRGTLRRIAGGERVREVSEVWDFTQIAEPGSTIVTYPDLPVPLYYYAIVADSAAELDHIAHRVEALVEIAIEDGPGTRFDALSPEPLEPALMPSDS